MDENDTFPGGYTDKNYLRKIQTIALREGEKMNKINISRKIEMGEDMYGTKSKKSDNRLTFRKSDTEIVSPTHSNSSKPKLE